MLFKKGNSKQYILAAHIGGKNTKVAVMSINSSRSFEIVFSLDYLTRKVGDICPVINNVLEMAKENHGIQPQLGCIAAAGPISRRRNYIKLTNIDLEIRRSKVVSQTHLTKVVLLNDYEAIAYGIDFLKKERDLIMFPHVGEDLTGGKTNKNTIAVIGAENELGMSIAQYIPDKDLHMAIPSEGGHIDFAAYTEFEEELVKYIQGKIMKRRNLQPEYERVLSAEGMENIFKFLASKNTSNKIVQKISKLRGLEMRSMIGQNYHANKVCRLTIDTFMGFYARACRNLALLSECYSGLYLADVTALRYLKRETDKKRILVRFMNEYEKHDKRSDVLRKVPVYMIINRNVSLLGCCNVATNFSDA